MIHVKKIAAGAAIAGSLGFAAIGIGAGVASAAPSPVVGSGIEWALDPGWGHGGPGWNGRRTRRNRGAVGTTAAGRIGDRHHLLRPTTDTADTTTPDITAAAVASPVLWGSCSSAGDPHPVTAKMPVSERIRFEAGIFGPGTEKLALSANSRVG